MVLVARVGFLLSEMLGLVKKNWLVEVKDCFGYLLLPLLSLLDRDILDISRRFLVNPAVVLFAICRMLGDKHFSATPAACLFPSR